MKQINNSTKDSVLFICSGNKEQGISPIVHNQGESIRKLGANVEYYPINAKGIRGYLSHFRPLRNKIKSGDYGALHAHYSYCGMLTAMASPSHRNIIVSLMGSFYKGSLKYSLIHFFTRFFWKAVIVKSERMRGQIKLKNATLIPNGVELANYSENVDREKLREELGFNPEKKYVVFVSDPVRPEKNYKLCEDAVALLDDPGVELLPVYNKKPEEVAPYQLAADVLMLASFNEGSPNVIKEALAAGCPIVSTDVGDARHNIGDTEGCYIMSTFDPEEASTCLRKALDFKGRTKGQNRIRFLGIDAESIGKKIIRLYLS